MNFLREWLSTGFTMDFPHVLTTLDTAVFNAEGRRLSEVEADILRGAWEGLTYPEIAQTSPYSLNYLKQDAGPNLWKLLSKVLGEPISKSSFRILIEKGLLKPVTAAATSETLPHPPTAETPGQKFSQMVVKLDKICFESSQKVQTSPAKSHLLNAYVQMMGCYFELFSRNMGNIPAGRINIKGQQRQELVIQLLTQLLEQVKHSSGETQAIAPRPFLYAVSYGDIHRWWQTSLSEEFIYLNGELAKYIHVERIFVLQNQQAEERMEKVMNFHRIMGIDHVYSLISEESTTQVSFLVYDSEFTNETFISEYGDELDGYVSVNQRDIEKNLKRFEAIKKLYAGKLRKIGGKPK